MKIRPSNIAFFIAASATVFATESQACAFSWFHYADDGIRDRISKKIGAKVSDQYCNRYNKDYEIVVIADAYSNDKQSLGHAAVGLRKRGSKEVPLVRSTGYRSDAGNYTRAYAMDLAAAAALDSLTEMMADLDAYAPSKK